MKDRYIDFIDLEGSFEEVLAACKVLGPSSDDKNETAVEGFLGDGYLVRGDAFKRDGTEFHRVYLADREMLAKLPKHIKYVFKHEKRQITVKLERPNANVTEATWKARRELVYRICKAGEEEPVTIELLLVKREYV